MTSRHDYGCLDVKQQIKQRKQLLFNRTTVHLVTSNMLASARLCLFFKFIHGLVAVLLPDYVQYSNRISRYCHPMAFRQVYTSKDYYKYSCLPLAIVQWNSLPESVASLQNFRGLQGRSLQVAAFSLIDTHMLVFI